MFGRDSPESVRAVPVVNFKFLQIRVGRGRPCTSLGGPGTRRYPNLATPRLSYICDDTYITMRFTDPKTTLHY